MFRVFKKLLHSFGTDDHIATNYWILNVTVLIRTSQ